MSDVAVWTLIGVFALDALMFVALIVLKMVNRARQKSLTARRDRYIELLSRHLAYGDEEQPIPEGVADDEAFLDAVIDLRNTITGSEVARLSDIAKRFDLIERQKAALDRRWLATRRLRAAVSLAELGDDSSASTLMGHLDDPEREIRIQCARGLARIGHTPAIDRILDRLEVEDDWVRARFGDALAAFGHQASQPLMAYVLVNHQLGDEPAVCQAIRTLAVIGDYTIGPRVAQVLDQSSKAEVQIAAASALGEVGGTFATPSLLDALHSSDWRVQAQAASALGDIGDGSVLDELAAALKSRSWWVRRNAASALAALPEGIEMLYRSLSSVDPFARDAAAEALEDAGELTRARKRSEAGTASRDDLRLLRHMRGNQVIPA